MSDHFFIWYSDSTMIEGNTRDDWEAAAAVGVQIVYVAEGFDPHGRRLGRWILGSDHYWHDGDRVTASGISAPVKGDWAVNTAPAGASVKTGEWIDDDLLVSIQNTAAEMIKHG